MRSSGCVRADQEAEQGNTVNIVRWDLFCIHDCNCELEKELE